VLERKAPMVRDFSPLLSYYVLGQRYEIVEELLLKLLIDDLNILIATKKINPINGRKEKFVGSMTN
jgi:hypothetical protein